MAHEDYDCKYSYIGYICVFIILSFSKHLKKIIPGHYLYCKYYGIFFLFFVYYFFYTFITVAYLYSFTFFIIFFFFTRLFERYLFRAQ